VIYGVAVVFPVVITFGVAGVLAGRHAQALFAAVFPVVTTFGVDKRRPLCTGEQRSRPSGANVASILNML